jgi:outer membrane protein assembly factor BamB
MMFVPLDEVSGEPVFFDAQPKFRMGQYNTGVVDSSGPRTNETVWVTEVDGAVRSSPVVDDGRLVVGTMAGKVLCLNAFSGSVLWEYVTDGPVESTPIIVDDRVFVGSDDTFLYCLNVTNGDLIWRTKTASSIKSSPAFDADRIFVGSSDFDLHVFDADDGEELWNFSTEGYVYSSPLIVGSGVFFGSCDGNIYRCDAADGSLEWTFQAEYAPASPAYANDQIVVGTYDDTMYILDPETGDELVNISGASSGIYSSVAAFPTTGTYPRLYYGDNDGTLFFTDEEGSVEWTMRFEGGITSSPTVAYDHKDTGSLVIVGSGDGSVYAIEDNWKLVTKEPPSVLWSLELGMAVDTSAFLYNEKVYIGAERRGGKGAIACIGVLDPDREAFLSISTPDPPAEGLVELTVETLGFVADSVEISSELNEYEASPVGDKVWEVSFEPLPPEEVKLIYVRAIIDGQVFIEDSVLVQALIEGVESVFVTVNEPDQRASVGGNVVVRGSASSAHTVREVRVWWDDDVNNSVLWVPTTEYKTFDNWTIVVSSAGLSSGKHTLNVEARDKYRSTSAGVVVNVEGPAKDVGDVTTGEVVLIILLVIVFAVLLVTKPPRVSESPSPR